MKSPEDKHPILTLVKANKSGEVVKQLNPRHKQAILFHLQGCRLQDISEKTGLSIWHISRILNSNLAREMIAEFNRVLELEFRALQRKAIDAVKDGLSHPDINIRLKAADRWFKVCGKNVQSDMEGISAEDVVKEIMESSRRT